MDYYCNICDKTINHKSKNRHNKTERHYFMKTYVTNTYNYNDFVWDDFEKILHEDIISHNNKSNEFKIYVSCKLNDNVEIKRYKDEFELHAVLPTFLEPFKTLYDVGTLYVHDAGKMLCNNIRENLSSKYDINCTPDMKIRSLTLKFVSRYGNMTYRYYMHQPRPTIESKMVKHLKYMSHEEQFNNYNFLTCKHKLILL